MKSHIDADVHIHSIHRICAVDCTHFIYSFITSPHLYLCLQWCGSKGQLRALRQGVGLATPDSFWTDIAASSSLLSPRDRVSGLGHRCIKYDNNK